MTTPPKNSSAKRKNANANDDARSAHDDRLAARSALLCAWATFEVRRGGARRARRPSRWRERYFAKPRISRRVTGVWSAWARAEGEALRGVDGGETASGIVAGDVRRRANPAAARQTAVLDEGLAANPGNARLAHARAMATKMAGDVDGARDALEKLLERHPASAHAWHALGTLLQERGEFERAVDAFERGASCAEEDDGADDSGANGANVNLPCLTAAAAAAFHGGDTPRAERLFMRGSATAGAHSRVTRRRTPTTPRGMGRSATGSDRTFSRRRTLARTLARATGTRAAPRRGFDPAPRRAVRRTS